MGMGRTFSSYFSFSFSFSSSLFFFIYLSARMLSQISLLPNVVDRGDSGDPSPTRPKVKQPISFLEKNSIKFSPSAVLN